MAPGGVSESEAAGSRLRNELSDRVKDKMGQKAIIIVNLFGNMWDGSGAVGFQSHLEVTCGYLTFSIHTPAPARLLP